MRLFLCIAILAGFITLSTSNKVCNVKKVTATAATKDNESTSDGKKTTTAKPTTSIQSKTDITSTENDSSSTTTESSTTDINVTERTSTENDLSTTQLSTMDTTIPETTIQEMDTTTVKINTKKPNKKTTTTKSTTANNKKTPKMTPANTKKPNTKTKTTKSTIEGNDTTKETKSNTADDNTTTKLTTVDDDITTEMSTTKSPTCPDKNTLNQSLDAIFDITPKYFLEVMKDSKMSLVSTLPTMQFISVAGLYTPYGQQSDRIFKLLNLFNNDQVRCAYEQIRKILLKYLNEFVVTTNFFLSLVYNPTHAFKEDVKKYLGGDTVSININDRVDTTNLMNNVIKKNTNDKIQKVFLNTDSIDDKTQFVVGTGAYFKIPFKNGFDKDITKCRYYTSASKYNYTECISQRAIYYYAFVPEWNAKIVRIDLDILKGYLYIVVPKSAAGMRSILRDLDSKKFKSIISTMTPTVLNVLIPKFGKMCTNDDVKETLKQVTNVDEIFNPKVSKSVNVVEDNKQFGVTAYRQETCIMPHYNMKSAPIINQENPPLPIDNFSVDRLSFGMGFVEGVTLAMFTIGLE